MCLFFLFSFFFPLFFLFVCSLANLLSNHGFKCNAKVALDKKKKITWLDIANAYASVPHNLIQIALQRTHAPEYFRDLVESYYNDTKIRFSTTQFTTEWQRVEKGIITGCTLSVVLFALTMTMLVMSAKDESKGPTMASGQRQESCRLWMM